MRRTLLFFLLLALAGVFGGSAYAQCTYTTKQDGNFNDPATYIVTGTTAGGCNPIPAAGSTIVINHAVTVNQNFTSTGLITINATGSLMQDGADRSLSLTNGTFTISPLTTTTRGLLSLAVAVLDLQKTLLTVGSAAVV